MQRIVHYRSGSSTATLVAVPWLALMAALVLSACATQPEAKLKQGYDSASAGVRTTTVLVQRRYLSPDEGVHVYDLGTTAKQILDGGKERLAACRADEAAGLKVDCSKSVSAIDLGSGVLLQIEQFLSARAKGVK